MTTPQNKVYRHGHGSDEQHKKDQALFAELLENHQQLTRVTEKTSNGIVACTTSEDPHLAGILQKHVESMETRFGHGRAIRSWDPLFAALFEYRDRIVMTYETIDKGVKATLSSDDPKLIELIHCHDETLHKFVNEGYRTSGEESPKPDWLD